MLDNKNKEVVNKTLELLNKLSKQEFEELLRLEKERRGVNPDQLVFIGMANVANYQWCAAKSVLHSRREELTFFRAYLEDRIWYSAKLGFIRKAPKRMRELLLIGDEITFEDVEKLLKEREREMGKFTEVVVKRTGDNTNDEFAFIHSDETLSTSDYFVFIDVNNKITYHILNKPINQISPITRGEILHTTQAENYPTIRWNFEWDNYVVVGVPDGITDNFVYEFKTTRNRFLYRFVKPVAFAQADLYGYFFKRPRKRVQIKIMEEDMVETWEGDVNVKNAESVLEDFKAVDAGYKKPIPPKRWKR